jgi:hypothetical protein
LSLYHHEKRVVKVHPKVYPMHRRASR